jgi:alkylation response protein AidB-like acyl-CoA dehydrogenase
MDFAYPAEAEALRDEVREWLSVHLVGDFCSLGTSSEFSEADWDLRVAWEREMGAGGWIGLEWPRAMGGRQASAMEALVFAEEYASAEGPTRAGTFGEGMLGPTLIHFGTDDQRARFLPPILRGEEIWCQGFSEPGAGSDLAGVSTRASLDGDRWVIDGQKVWTSQAHLSDWIFVLVRTDTDAPKHRGLSFLLVPLDQTGVEVRPLVDMIGGRHFCEVFFDGATTASDLIVGTPGDGWKIAMATLGFERGTAFIAQLKHYAMEWQRLVDVARGRGCLADPMIRQRLADSRIGLELMRFGLYRTVTSVVRDGRPGPESSIGKLQWSQWHQALGELAFDILGAEATLTHKNDDALHEIEHAFLFSRAHTIYAGSSQVQRNIIGERVLGLPKEPESPLTSR